MARSATLNPASVPFFPGGIRGGEESSAGLRYGNQLQEQDQNSISSLSISPSDYRSITSSPPLSAKRDYLLAQSPEPLDTSQPSAVNRQLGSSRQYNALESKTLLDATSQTGVSADIEAGESTPSPNVTGTRTQTSGSIIRSLHHNREKCATPPVSVSFNGASSSSQISGFHSVSPVSSLDSGSHFSANDNQTSGFDAQLRASPLIRDILERLSRCETFAMEIQHDLGEVHQKVNLLLERALVTNTQPEFKDPFAPSLNGNNFSSQFTAPRPSIGNIAPNQVPAADDITTISQRLNTLTSSVGQLLALQTQQLQANAELRSNSVINTNIPQPDLSPNQMLPSVITGHPVLGHGLPNRQDLRPSPRSPNPPLRTWSAGNIDLSMRPGESSLRQEPLTRDKRRSVAVLRRDSTTVGYP